jgi:hypothetical protein
MGLMEGLLIAADSALVWCARLDSKSAPAPSAILAFARRWKLPPASLLKLPPLLLPLLLPLLQLPPEALPGPGEVAGQTLKPRDDEGLGPHLRPGLGCEIEWLELERDCMGQSASSMASAMGNWVGCIGFRPHPRTGALSASRLGCMGECTESCRSSGRPSLCA